MKKALIPHLVILLIYCVISFIFLFSDRKEPDRLTFDIAFPKLEETEPNKTSNEIEELVYYTPPIDNVNILTQTIYTPKIVSGIDIWLKNIEPNVFTTYVISFYNPDNTLAYTQDFSTKDISNEGYTTIIFDDFKLPEGKQYNMTITPRENSFSVIVGMVYDNSSWAGGLYDKDGLIKNTILCFNLIYDYQNFGFLNWMVLTLICVFLLIYTAKKEGTYGNPNKKCATYIIILIIMIVLFVIVYSNVII